MKKLIEKATSYLKGNAKDVINLFYKFLLQLSDEHKEKRKAKVMLRVIRRADRKAKAYCRCYYVLRDWNGSPYSANRDEIKAIQKLGLFKHKFDIDSILAEALYIAYPYNSKSNEVTKGRKDR
ncbi:MAG: hypothetical protein WCS17_01405 [Prevotella sp.]